MTLLEKAEHPQKKFHEKFDGRKNSSYICETKFNPTGEKQRELRSNLWEFLSKKVL